MLSCEEFLTIFEVDSENEYCIGNCVKNSTPTAIEEFNESAMTSLREIPDIFKNGNSRNR
jgi:hypothetical protein